MGLPTPGINLIVVNVVFLSLAFVAVCLRFWARKIKRTTPGLSDYCIGLGFIFTASTVIIGILMVTHGGAGLHVKDASHEQVQALLKLFVAAPILWVIATCFVKLSILFFYVDIFPRPGFRMAVYVVMAFVLALFGVVMLESFLLCRPFAFTWNKAMAGTCGSAQKAYLAVAVLNLAIDISIVCLPMHVLWSLRMPFRKKLAVSGILGLGLIVCVITSLRIVSLVELDESDFTYTVVLDSIWGGMEIELGIICACLPFYQPLISKVFGGSSTFWSRLRSNRGSSGGGKKWSEYSAGTPLRTNNSDDSTAKRSQRLDVKPVYPLDDFTTTCDVDSMVNDDVERAEPGRVTVTRQVDVYQSEARS
ncbi:MAG: hypothetical protein M1816_003014 [Peltula sp. TS41687]|nr:MAG: hypothetical protein M1816_003014 [Peltula sp. TS41687]